MAVEINLVDYEVFYNKLFNVTDEAKEVVRYLSGSTITREAGEVQVAIYDRDSYEAGMITCGVLMHIMTVTRCLNYMKEQGYEEDIGYYDGDQFINNDAYIGGMHVPDVAVVAPFYYKGELVCFVAALSHTSETGGIEPGGMCPSATECYHDGLICPAVKLVEKGKMRRDVFNMLARGVRDPKALEIDMRARIAGNQRAKQRLTELIDDVGVEFFLSAMKQLLNDAEKGARAKVKQLEPGVYSTMIYSDAIGTKGNKLATIYQEMEITEDGELIFHYPIVSPQLPCYNNCYEPAVEASLFYTLIEKIFYDIRWNTAFGRVLKIDIPHGTRLSADSSQSVGYCTVGIGDTQNHAITESLSMAQYVARQEFEVEASTGSINSLVSGGIDQYDRPCANISIACAGGSGSGGRIGRDGIDSGFGRYNPFNRTPDTESEEFIMPFMTLTINHRPDTGGFGKWRGGTSINLLYLAHNTRFQSAIVVGGHGNIPQHNGLYGGYPSAALHADIMFNTNFYEVAKKGKIPLRAEDLPEVLTGDYEERTANKPGNLKTCDIIVGESSGGAGLGDPIERDPELIKKDIIEKLATVEVSSKVYCVAIDPDTMEIDHEKTKRLREEKIKERLNQGIPGGDYLKKLVQQRKKRDLSKVALENWNELTGFLPTFREWLEREEKLAQEELKPLGDVKVKRDLLNITPYVKVVETEAGQNVNVCRECGFVFCKAEENFKLYSLIYERDPREVHPGRLGYPSDWCLYREFYCPGCGRQIEMETIVPGAPIVHSIRLKKFER